MVPLDSTGFSEPVGRNAAGLPIYLYYDKWSNVYHYVVALPDGRYAYSNQNGEPLQAAPPILPSAFLGGAIGYLFGPVGALVGAAVGGLLASKAGEHRT